MCLGCRSKRWRRRDHRPRRRRRCRDRLRRGRHGLGRWRSGGRRHGHRSRLPCSRILNRGRGLYARRRFGGCRWRWHLNWRHERHIHRLRGGRSDWLPLRLGPARRNRLGCKRGRLRRGPHLLLATRHFPAARHCPDDHEQQTETCDAASGIECHLGLQEFAGAGQVVEHRGQLGKGRDVHRRKLGTRNRSPGEHQQEANKNHKSTHTELPLPRETLARPI